MRIPELVRRLVPWASVIALVTAAFMTRDAWLPLLGEAKAKPEVENTNLPIQDVKVVKLTKQARKNLGLTSSPARPQTYWRTIQVPGTIVDRPGYSDRGITSPAVGVVTRVHAFPGDVVKAGDRLFTLRLFSEYLQSSQKELLSATRESEFVQSELDRLRPLAERGSVAKTKIIDLENQLARQKAVIQTQRQDLITRGLSPSQIEDVAEGNLVTSVEVVAPHRDLDFGKAQEILPATVSTSADPTSEFLYEVQELHAELGQQVQAGQLLSTLANHESLYIEGHAFKSEATLLENAAQQGWNIEVEFAEDDPEHWPDLDQKFEIRHLSNSIDTRSRTFDFYIPLQNQSRDYTKENETFIVWRFRPGQRVRLQVPIARLEDVLVLPVAALVREGPEAYVFQQNGDLFNRLPVHVLHEDRSHVVIANDGSVIEGVYLAQTAAAVLNRTLQAQAASGLPANVHVHADGTVHASH
ncbi:MAG: HlyD family efflux transporter periplasmic adaptor subunit [Planctomycetota bacterium]|nr:HlyD family efflux transporter periplasmic adaptor subunit [Planctomycetota bacterium]